MIKVIKSGNTNCFLLEDSGKWFLIDAGIKTDSNFLENLKQIIPIEKIDLLILTHGHYDHVGHAAFIQKHYGIPIAIHKADMLKVVLGKMEFPKAKSILGNIIRTTTLKEMSKATYEPFTPDIIFENDVNIENTNLKIITLEGHTAGSIGIQKKDILFAGDLVMNMPFPSSSWFAEDFCLVKESIKKAKGLSIEKVYPSHGKPFSVKWL